MSTLTPEQFMTLTEPDDDPFEVGLGTPPSPLETIATAVSYIASLMAVQQAELVPGVLISSPPSNEVLVDRQDLDDTRQALADLEDKHATLYKLLEEIEAILKPSTSKLAISVRAAIDAWRAPEVPTVGHPAHDAPLDEWREWARSVDLVGCDGMNRSEIRTALGIEQPA